MPVASVTVSTGIGGRQVPWSLLREPDLATVRLSGRFVKFCSGIICTDVGTSAVPGNVCTCLGLLAVPWCGVRDVLFSKAGMQCGVPLEKENYSSETAGVLMLFFIM